MHKDIEGVEVNPLRHWPPGRIETVACLCVLGALATGCGHLPNLFDEHSAWRPRPRTGRYATATIGGATFPELRDVGRHGYVDRSNERSGIVYTCRAGHIDLAHVRKSADWTAYAAEITQKTLREGQTEFTLKVSDPVRYFVTLNYPCDWKDRTPEEQDRASREVSIALGQYLGFAISLWHEIITWFGYRNVPLYPEFVSAFSWEDCFSDLLGSHLGAAALRDAEHGFDEAMTLTLRHELEKLGVQPRDVAVQAAKAVEGIWYSGNFLFLVQMKKRNLDIGLDDGSITPWIVPGLDECAGAEPQPYAIPSLEALSEFGFDTRVEIEPGGLERNKIMRAAGLDPRQRSSRVVPEVHFEPIMAHIRRQAVERYGPYVDTPGPAEKLD